MDLSTPLNASDGYRQLLEQISDTYTQGRVQAVQAVNAQLVQTYWQVGRHIVEFEQAGQVRAEYGKALIDTLAVDLGLRHGKGFSRVRIQGVRDQATPRRRRDASAVINRNGRPARLRATDGYQPLSAALGNRLGGGVLSIQAMTA